jgi:hypothetical protein
LDGSIPIKVDPENHEKVAIDWEVLRAEYEQEKAARRDALAAGGPAGATVTMGETTVIDANADPEVMEQVRQMLGQMGIDVQGQPAGDGVCVRRRRHGYRRSALAARAAVGAAFQRGADRRRVRGAKAPHPRRLSAL